MYVNITSNGDTEIHIDRDDTWSMDQTLAQIIVPMLKQLKCTKIGVPTDFFQGFAMWDDQLCFDFIDRDAESEIAETKWEGVLDHMIWSFEQISEGKWLSSDFPPEFPNLRAFHAHIQAGVDLFAKHYGDLWD